ncbi:Gfo/Idh/MocA family protein [Celeribacter litoreus]|uniref:Gfo/Idh/MocA family protein n=1 Tax=Celeribacter litoreus TaxID=2876714 RepID=UPI001CCDD9CA|nr:Gfo/Idh/MocA family oxidoreductase [Celeribacter litoreus]MCA0042179.1 Gfo/Idh/MocA family oxidoreductase [Celeribacter litoreus]
MKIGLVGYGTGGRHFHAPFIMAAEGIELAGIVARSESKIAQIETDYPGLPIYASLPEMLAAGVDAVTITTPPETRRELVLEAIEAGVHVVADKPFAPSAEVARELDAAAKAKGVVLSVFHNRRCDTDVRTLKGVLDGGELGKIWRVHSRMDMDDPATLELGPSGGLLRDMGSHVIDQMVWLFGPVASVSAHLDMIESEAGPTDAGFVVSMRHKNGVFSQVSSSKLNKFAENTYRVYGENGCYLSYMTDVQTLAIFADKRPLDDLKGWGYEVEENWPELRTASGVRKVPSEQGRYHDYHEAFAKACKTGTPPPVPPSDAIEALRILDAARISATEHRDVSLLD